MRSLLRNEPPRVRLNLLLPFIAAVTVVVGVVAWGVTSIIAPSPHQRLLAAVSVSADQGVAVLPTSAQLSALAKPDLPSATRTSTREPQGLVISTLSPQECASLWVSPDPANTRHSGADWQLKNERRTVQSRVEVLANRATATARFAELRKLSAHCDSLKVTDIAYQSGLTRQMTAATTQTTSGIPKLVLNERTTFVSDSALFGWLGTERFYLVGNAVFALSVTYDRAPGWVEAQFSAFEHRLDRLVSTATKPT